MTDRLQAAARPSAFALAIACAALALSAHAERVPTDDPLQNALTVWQDGLRQVHTIASDFVQEKRIALFQDVLIIRGRLFITTEGRFAWETHSPVRYKLVVADGRIRQWDEETGRVQTIGMRDNPAAATIHEQMSVWFTGRFDDLTQTYSVSLAEVEPVTFLFTPREGTPAAEYISTVRVRLRPDGQYLDQVHIAEHSGDHTSILFTNTVINQPLPEAAWNVQTLSARSPADSAPPPAAHK